MRLHVHCVRAAQRGCAGVLFVWCVVMHVPDIFPKHIPCIREIFGR